MSLQAFPSAQVLHSPFTRAERGGFFTLVALLFSSLAGAQDTPSMPSPDEREETYSALDPVVVVSTRSPRPVREVVGMVTALDDTDLASRLVTDQESLWRYTPGIQVESSGARFGERGLSIRGIGGNRVLIERDGIPVQDRFAVGSVSSAGRSSGELDFVKRVEVLRGPASSLYGSKALGGVVAFATFDPEDFAAWPGQVGGQLRGAWAGDRDAAGAAALGAWRGAGAGALLGVSRRHSGEPDRSAVQADPDRLDAERDALLAKVTLGAEPGARLRLTLDADRESGEAEMNSLAGTSRFASTTRLSGEDETRRHSLALDGRFEHGALTWEGLLFWRETRTRQDTADLRELLPRPVRIDREFRYDDEASGARARVARQLTLGGFRHRLMAGGEFTRTEMDAWRDARQTGLVDGVTTNVVLGERFPLRDFPLTTRRETGVFVQDEIDTLSGRWTVIPAVRFDHTRISVQDDAGWRQANPGADPAELSVSDTSPRLGVLWQPSRAVQAWGQVASGFRAPPSEDLNIGLDIPLFRTRALPNPELESESSLGWEAGLRVASRGAWMSVAAFWTDYEDFIVSMAPLGPDPATGTLLFQSRNLDRARIRGFEFEAGAPLGLLTSRLDAWEAGVSGYWADGEDLRSGDRLDSVGPPSGVLYLDWTSASGRWDVRFSGLFSRGQARVMADGSPGFRAPGYGIFDVTTRWRATERLTLHAGVFNVSDRTWWRWGEVGRLPEDDPLIPALSAPGRTASISFSLALGSGHL